MKFRKLLRGTAVVGAAAVLAACETTPVQPSENFVGDTVVVTDYASFYRLGPQQAGGPDRTLRNGERVMLMRKEFGYSRVQLSDDQIGYIANEDLQPAPPEPRRRRGESRSFTGSSRGGESSAEYFDDIALPDPSLDILPEDVPIEPLPDLVPESVDPTPAPTPAPTPEPVKESLPAPASEEAPPVSTST